MGSVVGCPALSFTYPPALIGGPIVYRLGMDSGAAPNIWRAQVSRDRGWGILDLGGDGERVDRALAWAQDLGMVEPVDGEFGD